MATSPEPFRSIPHQAPPGLRGSPLHHSCYSRQASLATNEDPAMPRDGLGLHRLALESAYLPRGNERREANWTQP